MMKFSTPFQMVALTVAWGGALFAVDYLKHPRAAGAVFKPDASPAAPAGAPQISLWVNHLCCTGCLSDLSEAVGKFRWVPKHGIHVDPAKPLMAMEIAEKAVPVVSAGFGNRVDIDVTDIRLVDFVALDRAIRDAGLVAGRMELKGIPHFRLSADLKHVCCRTCSGGLEQGLDLVKAMRATGQMLWLDSVTLSKERKAVVAHARYDKTADVAELISALNQIGFAPVAIWALTDPER